MTIVQEESNKESSELEQQLQGQLGLAVGAYCEVKTMTNQLITLGRLHAVHENLAISVVSAEGAEMPSVIYNTQVKLVIRPRKQGPMVLRALVCGSSTSRWKLDQIEPFSYKESRSYFRQPVTVQASACLIEDPFPKDKTEVTPLPENPPPCTVLDVSLEGVRFRCSQRFERGDWVKIMDLRLRKEDRRPFELLGQVCWADRAGRNEFMFGCSFAPMTQADQDQLCAAIFALQRLELQGRKKNNRYYG